jgi:hypothetical protein
VKPVRVIRERGLGYVLREGPPVLWFRVRIRVQSRWRSIAAGVVRRRRGSRRFTFEGASYEYLIHPGNRTWRNERTIEVPIALGALERHRGQRILEVGNVLGLYTTVDHDGVDKYDESVKAVDIVDYTADPYDFIVSISTVEHIGWDEDMRVGRDRVGDPQKVARAIEHLRGLLKAGGELLVTFPLGYNPALDKLVDEGRLPFGRVNVMERVGPDNSWREAGIEAVRDAEYDFRRMHANVLVVASG